jgi:hypothetical protein
MTIGISTTKTVVVLAETQGAAQRFVITALRPIPFQVGGGAELAELLHTLSKLFDRYRQRAGLVMALLKCSSGRFSSGLAAIKAEAMIELAATQHGLSIVTVPPQSLKKALGGAPEQKWRARALQLFNRDGQRLHWSPGAAGAVAVAFKVAGEIPAPIRVGKRVVPAREMTS